MQPWGLSIAAGKTGHCCCGDGAILPWRLCNAAMETVQCCCGDCAILPGDCGMWSVVVHRHREL